MKITHAALALPLILSLAAAAPRPVNEPAADEIVIEFDEPGVELVDFLKLAQGALQKQIFYAAYEIKDVTIQALGKATIPRADIRRYLESTLYGQGFLLIPTGDALTLYSMRAGRQGGMLGAALKARAEIVPHDKVQEYEGRFVVISTVVPVVNNSAQEIANIMQTYFTDPATESVRATGSTIVMTGLPQTVITCSRLIAELDKNEGQRKDATSERISRLEAKVAELEGAVKSLVGK